MQGRTGGVFVLRGLGRKCGIRGHRHKWGILGIRGHCFSRNAERCGAKGLVQKKEGLVDIKRGRKFAFHAHLNLRALGHSTSVLTTK